MTDSMSDEAQAARAKKAQQNLAKAHATGARSASDLADALAAVDPDPVSPAHITGTPVTPAETCIDRNMEVSDERHLQAEDSPDRIAAPGRKSPIADLQSQTIADLRQLLAAADARVTAQDAEIRRLCFALQLLSPGPHSP